MVRLEERAMNVTLDDASLPKVCTDVTIGSISCRDGSSSSLAPEASSGDATSDTQGTAAFGTAKTLQGRREASSAVTSALTSRSLTASRTTEQSTLSFPSAYPKLNAAKQRLLMPRGTPRLQSAIMAQASGVNS